MDNNTISIAISFFTLIATITIGFLAFIVAKRQNSLTTVNISSDWLRDCRKWANESIEALTDVAFYYENDGKNSLSTAIELRKKLSTLIDQGRLLFPSSYQNVQTLEELISNRGYRHIILDALVSVEGILSEKFQIYKFDNEHQAVLQLKKDFIAITQYVLSTHKTNYYFNNLIKVILHEKLIINIPTGYRSEDFIKKSFERTLGTQVNPEL